jgi:hypothetical protein
MGWMRLLMTRMQAMACFSGASCVAVLVGSVVAWPRRPFLPLGCSDWRNSSLQVGHHSCDKIFNGTA